MGNVFHKNIPNNLECFEHLRKYDVPKKMNTHTLTLFWCGDVDEWSPWDEMKSCHYS